MAGWLSRATSLFHQPPPPPEPFEVECDCGGKVAGQRNSTYQRPACPACERPVFVLPANVYPRPKTKTSPVAKTENRIQDKKPVRSTPNEVVDDNPPPTPVSNSTVSTKSLARRGTSNAPIADPNLLREPPKRLITPLRLASIAIIFMSALTIGGLWRRNRIENAKAIVTKATDAGRVAIEDRDYITAAMQYERAKQAVDILGRTDDAAQVIRQNSREATALANLATSTLTECVEETLSLARPGQSEPLRMSSVVHGAWVIFDANMNPSAEGKDKYLVDGAVVLKDAIVQIEIESPLFRNLVHANDSNESTRVIFAAQLENLSPCKGDPPTSVLTLNGKTAFLWANYETYNSIGYHPFDQENEQQAREIRALLERQRQIK